MPARTGQQYLDGLKAPREIYLEGERVDDIASHPRLARAAQTIARLYDLQHDAKLRDELTFESPTTGDRVPLSYIVPQSYDDLIKRRRAFEIIAQAHHGILGRTPDYVNTQVTTLRQIASVFGSKEPSLGENLIRYHEYIRENDLCLTHAFGHPQVNRAAALTEQPDPYIATGIVEETKEGLIVRGAKQLATLAPLADEIFCPPFIPARPDEGMFCIGFAIPAATPGLKFVCREGYDKERSLYDRPLSGLYDELDALVVFEDVLVPWDRVFSYKDVELHNQLATGYPLHWGYMQQVMARVIAKLEFILGVAHELTEAVGIGGFPHIQEKMSEIIDSIETIRAYMRAAEADAGPWEGEGWWLSPEPCNAMRDGWPDMYDRIATIMQQMAAGGLMLTPTEADMTGDLKPIADKYLQGANIAAPDRVRLFRLIWDLIGTDFGSRSTLYERFFHGDVVRLRQRRFASYDYTRAKQSYESFMAEVEERS